METITNRVNTVADQPEIVFATPENGCCGLGPSLRFSEEEAETMAAAFKAIAHPVRLQIVELLSRYGGQACVCDIESQFHLSQPTISHHLKILRSAGLIDCRKHGLWVYYFTVPGTLEQLARVMQSMAASSG